MNSFFALKKRLAAAEAHRESAGMPNRPTRDSQSRESRPRESNQRRIDAASGPSSVLTASDLVKSYRKGRHLVPVLLGVDLTIRAGEFLAIEGQSGSGKSTLLHLLGLLDAPDGGEVHLDGRRIDNLRSRARDQLRNRDFGMIFQFYHLLPELSTFENVLVPAMISDGILKYWRHQRGYKERANELLELVGLSHRLTHRPHELSGGEMQRAAIARALMARPRVLLADEPTGNLDRKNGQEIMRILRTLNRQENVTIVMVTHDHGLAGQADRIVQLAEGRVQTGTKSS